LLRSNYWKSKFLNKSNQGRSSRVVLEQERSFTKDKKKKRKDTQERLKIQSQRQETKTGDSVKSVRFFKFIFQEL
jgi:Flp pilus assembly protein TadB